MSNKLAKKAKKSKLKESMQSENQYKETTIRKIKSSGFPRSYRLDPEIINILKNTLYRVNENSLKKVSETRLIKALIFLSQDINDEKLLKALKEVW